MFNVEEPGEPTMRDLTSAIIDFGILAFKAAAEI